MRILLFALLVPVHLFAQENKVTFQEIQESVFYPNSIGASIAVDVDNINGNDILLSGWNNATQESVTYLYLNDGSGNFTRDTTQPFMQLAWSSLNAADVDGDQDQDILITGIHNVLNPTYVSKLYLNDGNGNFTEKTGLNLEGVTQGATAFGDVDGDLDLDLIIAGQNLAQELTTTLYRNTGGGNFEKVDNTPFDPVMAGTIAFADVDDTNGLDIFIGGYNENQQYGQSAFLYMNDGSGNYIKRDSIFDGLGSGEAAFADFDQDGDQDLFMAGHNHNYEAIAQLYQNDGDGYFTLDTEAVFKGSGHAAIAVADIDLINGPDIIITGAVEPYVYETQLYLNQEDNSFRHITDTPFPHATDASVVIADFTGDTIPDVFLTGYAGLDTKEIARLYANSICKGQETVMDAVTACGSYTSPSGQLVWNVPGTHTLYDTLLNQCGADSTLVIPLTLHPISRDTLPTVFLCQGEDYLLPDGTLLTNIPASKHYISTLTSAEGCDSIQVIPIDITPFSDSVLAFNPPFLYAHMFNAEYQWLLCSDSIMEPISGETARTFEALVNGFYAVEVRSAGCVDTSACHYVIVSNIEEHQFSERFTLYPNPTTGEVKLEALKDINAVVHIFIRSISGRLVKDLTFEPHQTMQFRIDEAPGIYLIEVRSDWGVDVLLLNKS